MSTLLSEKDTEDIRKFFSENLVDPVTLRLFVQDKEKPGMCIYCDETEQITQELAGLSEKINLEVHLYPTEETKVKEYDVQRVPALILEKSGSKDSGVRFYGAPSGYEFGTLIEGIAELSTGKVKLSADLIHQVENIEKDISIKVFVTPT